MEPRSEHIQAEPVESERARYEILSNPEARERLRERMVELTDRIHERGIGAVVFLDNSARPLSWMFSTLWSARYPEEKKPDVRYVNVGSTTYEHAGAGYRLGGTASEISSFLADALRRKVDGMNLPSDWLHPGDVPGTWQQNIAQHTDELERLEGMFRQGFDDRRVLVVDDLISSGRSVLVALSALSAAFPRAEFFGTALFKSDGRGKAADRRMVPWLSVPGMSGILEIPESDLISSRITEAETDRIRTVLREAFQGHMRVMLAHAKSFESSSTRLAQFVASCDDADVAVRTRVQDGLAEMEGMIRTLQATGTPEGFPRERFDSLVREQHELIRTINTQIPTARHGEMDRLLNDVGDATPTNYEEFDAACDIWQRLGPEGYGSVRAMMERARALRAELKRLADEGSSPSVTPR